ncbi:MAG: S8 family serine peptidase [Fimbriimonadales bacterium]|nr:S8 family serine peptidase [Fimbriimonadales bacterium]
MRFGRSILGLLIAPVIGGAFGVVAAQSALPYPQFSPPSVPVAPSLAPVVRAAAPEIVGIGGKLRLLGQNLGSDATAVVVFHPGVVAEVVERHTPNEIVVRVPIGAQSGPVKVVSRVNAPALRALQTQIGVVEGSESPAVQAEIARMKQQQGLMLAFGRVSNPVQRTIIVPYMEPKPTIRPEFEESGGLKIVRNRLIVDLKDFLSFNVALEIADRIGAELVGHFPVTNSYVLDLRRAPRDLQALEAIMAQVGRDPRVAEVWQDFALELRQVRFADVDVVDRYRHNYNAHLNGREDVWATDRIQAPGAWNLIERFITEDTNGNGQLDPGEDRNGNRIIDTGRAALYHVKVAVMDSGCDHNHREFAGVDLRKVVYGHRVGVRIAGREEILPLPASFDDSQAYDLGDTDIPYQHGTRVTSLIGARNGNVLDAVHNDRGINGLLHNPMPYTIQVYRFRADLEEPGDATYSVTGWLAGINMATLTGAKIINASLGSHVNSSLPTPPAMRIALRKIAHQLNLFRDKLLLVAAAGNEGDLIHPFEDLNLNNRLDAGEDANGNGRLDFGNDVAGSLGLLPNVIAVGAIGGPDNDPHPLRYDWAHDDQRAPFSNWGASVQIAAPGTDVFAAGGDRFLIGGQWFSRDDPNSTLNDTSGTSFATPLVSGTAALLMGINPFLGPSGAKRYILRTSYTVRTTDRAGAPMDWQTLKTGYAVRELMVHRDIIGDDQIWTGVSKVVYPGGMFEIRRGPLGRAEAFARRELNLVIDTPALAHHGANLYYIYGSRTIKKLQFTDGQDSIFVEVNHPEVLLNILEVSPSEHVLYAFDAYNFEGCWRWLEIHVRRANTSMRVADSTSYNSCRFGDNNTPQDWKIYELFRAAWRPDNRFWDMDYFYQSGRGNTIHNECRRLWENNPFPAPTRAFPECARYQYRYPSWSPDGRAYAGVYGENYLQISYYNAARTSWFVRGSDVTNPPVTWTHWSPDGSELAYSGENGIVTLRRDRRSVEDRSPLSLLRDEFLRRFTWQW